MREKAQGRDYQFKGGPPSEPDYLVCQIGDYIIVFGPDLDMEWA